MRFKPRRPQQRDTVLLAGWLFADLFLALAVIFLSANTGGVSLQPPTPTPTQVTPTVVPTVPPTPTPASLPRLELEKHRISLTGVNTDGLLNNDQNAINGLKQQMRSQSFLGGRTVGLAIVYAGAPDDTLTARAQDVSNKVMDVLRSLGSEGFAFTRTSYYDPLYLLKASEDTVWVDVYLFA